MTEDNSTVSPGLFGRFDWRIWLERFRQSGHYKTALLVAAAAAVALIVAFGLWSRSQRYTPLYHGLAEADAGSIMEALQQENIPFDIDSQTGALMVPKDNVHQVRLKLASQGLPRGTLEGFEILAEQNSFGVSQFMENARYQRALEGELARSIISIGAVQNARVHLALPKESVFIRNRQPPSASVLVQLHPGRALDQGQVAAIVHLVSSSVPRLDAQHVSIIDQIGNLLTKPGRDAGLGVSLEQLEYTRRLEERYVKRIEDIVTPLLGMGRVRAQIVLDMDFTVAEETAESYDSKQPPGMLRSEQLKEEINPRLRPQGIPGALSNQPPGAAVAPEVAQNPTPGTNDQAPDGDNSNESATDAQTYAEQNRNYNQRRETVRNYELDKRISHIRNAPGKIQRLSAAVVLDDRIKLSKDGELSYVPLTAEELDRIKSLIKEAIGYNAERGDTLEVLNVSFAPSPFDTPIPLWQQDGFLEMVKWSVIGIIAVLIVLMVLRPLVRRLASRPESDLGTRKLEGPPGSLVDEKIDGLEGDLIDNDPTKEIPQLGSAVEHLDKRLKIAKALVAEDPKRAVQVIKNWIVSES